MASYQYLRLDTENPNVSSSPKILQVPTSQATRADVELDGGDNARNEPRGAPGPPQRSLSQVGSVNRKAASQVRSVSEAQDKEVSIGEKLPGNPWEPGVWARFPWAGIGALLLVVGPAAAAVLAVSNGSPIQNWRVHGVKIQPQVWLSVLATIMDGLILFALSEGATITFWRKAASGTTLRTLHDHSESTAITGALKGISKGRFSIIAFACILAFSSALRGPLFQRATIINDHAEHLTDGTMQLRMAQTVPPGYLFGNGSIFSGSFVQLITQHTEHLPIPFHYDNCGKTCTTSLKGFGFDINCSSSSITAETAKDYFQSPDNDIQSAIPVFNASTSLYGMNTTLCGSDEECKAQNKLAASAGRIEISNLFKTEPGCTSDISLSTCTLRQGVVEYSVVLQNGTIALRYPHWQDDTFLFHTPPWDEFDTFDSLNFYPPSTSATNWVDFYNLQFNEEIDVYDGSDLGPWTSDNDKFLFQLARMFINDDRVNALESSGCNATFRDPTQYVLDRMREMAFRTGIAAARVTDMNVLFKNASLIGPGLPLIQNWTQAVRYTGYETRTVYSVSTPYLACAITVSLLGVVAVAPLLYGWWELGRRVSLNPLEVAKAFDAPILDCADGNAVKEDIVKQVGRMQVRYGVVDEDTGSRPRLKMFAERSVRKPEYGETFVG